MDLSATILYYELKELFPEAIMTGENGWKDELILPRPLFYGGGQTFESHCVYVVAPAELPAQPHIASNCLFICADPLSESYRHEKISAITISNNCSVIELYNAVVTIFQKYAVWDKTLRSLVLTNAPLADYLACSFPLITNPLSLQDNNYRYLARAGVDMIPEQYRYFNEQEFVDPVLITHDDDAADALRNSKELFCFRSPNISGEHLALNLFDGNTVVGLLVVSSHYHPIRAYDPSLIRHLAQYLETALRYAAYSGKGNNQLKETMLGLLSRRQYSDGETRHQQKLISVFKRHKDKKFYCLAALSRLPYYTAQYAAYQLEAVLPEAVAVPFESMVVLLYHFKSAETWDTFSVKVGAALSKLSMQSGCSDAFEDFFALSDYYKQAAAALMLGTVNDENQLIYRFKDYALEYFFQNGCSVIPARLLCANCIMRLAQRDKTAAVSYCESLSVFLDTGRNMAESARRLNIQRNSFLARLERIMRYLDLDLDDPEERLYLEISLRLLKA